MESLHLPDWLPLAGSLDDIAIILLGVFTFFKTLATPLVAAVTYIVRTMYNTGMWVVMLPSNIVARRKARKAAALKAEADAKAAAARRAAEQSAWEEEILEKWKPELGVFEPHLEFIDLPFGGPTLTVRFHKKVDTFGSGASKWRGSPIHRVRCTTTEIPVDSRSLNELAADRIPAVIRRKRLEIATALEGMSKV